MNIEKLINPKLWDKIESNYNAGKFTNAIVDSMFYLTNLLRERSDSDEDGLKLVGKIFKKENPLIQINKNETETEKNIQEGYAAIIRGLYQLIRNPRHHDETEDSKDDAIKILLFIDYVVGILDKAKSSYDIEEIESLIFDEDQIEDDEYMNLIINKIPKRKRFEIMLNVYNKRTKFKYDNFKRFFNCMYDYLSSSEISQLLNLASKNLLLTKNDEERKYIIASIRKNNWKNIEELARKRTENRILKSIESGMVDYKDRTIDEIGWFATWCTDLFSEFTLMEDLYDTISYKFNSNEASQIIYVFEYIFYYVCSTIIENDFKEKMNSEDPHLYMKYEFILQVRSEIENGNKLYYDRLRKLFHRLPKFLVNYYKEALDNFKEDIEKTTPGIDEPLNDLPF